MLHTCHDNCRNAWRHCQGVLFCADDEACHVFNKELISLHISSFPCNQFLTSFVWILPAVNIYVSGQIQLFKHFIGYDLWNQQQKPEFILLLQDNVNFPTLMNYRLHRHRSQVRWRDRSSKCWYEGIFRFPLAHCFPGWSPKRLVIRFGIVILTVIVTVGKHAESLIEILIINGSYASPSASTKRRRRRRSVAHSCHDLKTRQVISTKKLKEWQKVMSINIYYMN